MVINRAILRLVVTTVVVSVFWSSVTALFLSAAMAADEGDIRFYIKNNDKYRQGVLRPLAPDKDVQPNGERWSLTNNPDDIARLARKNDMWIVFAPWYDNDGGLLKWPNAVMYADAQELEDWNVFFNNPEYALRYEAVDPASAPFSRLMFMEYGCNYTPPDDGCPQYAADIGHPGFRAWFIAQLLQDLDPSGDGTRTYAGPRLDDVNLWDQEHLAKRFLVADRNDPNNDYLERHLPWNPRANGGAGAPYTEAAWQNDFATFVEEIRVAVKAAFPQMIIFHNAQCYEGDPDSNPALERAILAADVVECQRGFTSTSPTAAEFDQLLGWVDDVHELGVAIGLKAEHDTPNESEFHVASCLLVSRGDDYCGTNVLKDDRWQSPYDLSMLDANMLPQPEYWWVGWDLNLGKALTDRYIYQNVYRRDFECGIVLLNKPEQPKRTVSMTGQTFKRIDGSITGGNISMPAYRAKILLHTCGVPDGPAVPTISINESLP